VIGRPGSPQRCGQSRHPFFCRHGSRPHLGWITHRAAHRAGLVRLNTDGSLDTAFRAATLASAHGRPLLLQPDGEIIVDGKWRLNPDGSRDDAFFTGDDGAGVSAAGLLPNGDLLVTGDFAAFEQWPRPCLVRLLGGDAPAAGFFEFVEASSYANEDAGPALVRVRRGGATNEAATVEYATADITAKAGGDSIASRNIKDRGIDPTKSATS